MKKRDEILSITHKGHERYKGVVYIATLNDSTKAFKPYSCSIDNITGLIERIHVDELCDGKHQINFYISHNTYRSCKSGGNQENLFSLNNIVIDIDCHKDVDSSYLDELLHKFIATLEEKLCSKFPLWTFVNYTGRGIQLWWSFEQVSIELLWLYEITYNKLIGEIAAILESLVDDSGEKVFKEIEVDGTTYKTAGYFRLPETYNPRAKVMGKADFGNKIPYKFQELVDAANNLLEIPFEKGCSYCKWDFMLVNNKKRMTLIETLVEDRLKKNGALNLNVNTSYGDGYILLIYYNSARYLYSVEQAVEKTKKLSKKVKVSKKIFQSVIDDIDENYKNNLILKFRNSTIIQFLNLSEEEQNKYDFHAISKWDWSLCIPNKTRNRLLKEKREAKEIRIITLYNSGLTQAEVAKEMNICEKTVRTYLQKNNINRKQEHIRQIQLLKSENCKQKEVAETLNISLRTVKTYWNVA